MLCKHDWDLMSEVTTKSKIEAVTKLTDFRLTGELMEIFVRRKFIQLLKCKKCGKLKRFVEDI